MTGAIFAAVAEWGLPLLGLVTFLSCLALPVPASLAMLATGAFAASGEMSLSAAAAAAFIGAVLGDQVGYGIGRAGRSGLVRHLETRPKRARLLARAQDLTARHGGTGVFLSRWLFSPLGPYANFAAGLTAMRPGVFTLSAMAGEAVWVALYIGLGWTFADRLTMVAQLATDLSGLLAGLALMGLAAFWIRRNTRQVKPG